MSKECVLYDRSCTNCGECDICDLDPSRKCSNCGKCIDEGEEYRSVNIMEFEKMMEDINKLKKKKQR